MEKKIKAEGCGFLCFLLEMESNISGLILKVGKYDMTFTSLGDFSLEPGFIPSVSRPPALLEGGVLTSLTGSAAFGAAN